MKNANLYSWECKEQLNNLEATTAATATTTAPATSATSTTATPTIRLLSGLILGLGGVVHQQSVEGQAVGKDVVSDSRATDVDGVQGYRITALGSHLYCSEGGVHLRRDGGDGAVENRAW